MTDIKTGPNPLFLREEALRQAIEMLFFAYRDFTAEPDPRENETSAARERVSRPCPAGGRST